MKRHRFAPFSFVLGAMLLIVGATFLSGGAGIHAARPVRLWPASIVVIGLTLATWAAARAIRKGPSPAVAGVASDVHAVEEPVQAVETPPIEGQPDLEGPSNGGDAGGDHDDQ